MGHLFSLVHNEGVKRIFAKGLVVIAKIGSSLNKKMKPNDLTLCPESSKSLQFDFSKKKFQDNCCTK